MDSPEVQAKISAQRKGEGNPAFGRRWFNDGRKNFYLHPDDKKAKCLIAGMLTRNR